MKTLDQTARELANAHKEADPATSAVKLFPDLKEIHLVEITSAVPASGEVLPFKLHPDPANGVNFPSVVVLLHPEEWAKVKTGELNLPDGWNLGEAEDL